MLQSGIVTVKLTKAAGLWGAFGLFAIFVLRLVLSAPLQSVTFDEYAHVPSGYSYWRTGDFSLYSKTHPNKLWFTLPLLITSPQLDYDPTQKNIHPWAVGFSLRQWLATNPANFCEDCDGGKIFVRIRRGTRFPLH
jgi:hypothetical protein